MNSHVSRVILHIKNLNKNWLRKETNLTPLPFPEARAQVQTSRRNHSRRLILILIPNFKPLKRNPRSISTTPLTASSTACSLNFAFFFFSPPLCFDFCLKFDQWDRSYTMLDWCCWFSGSWTRSDGVTLLLSSSLSCISTWYVLNLHPFLDYLFVLLLFYYLETRTCQF